MYRKNTAGQFVAFQGVDATTGGIKSGVTWTMRRCIDGTFAAGGGTVTEDSTNGWYKCALAQADTNGNNIAFNFTGTGAVPQTVNIITDGSPPDVNLKNAAGTAVTLDANNVLNVSAKYVGGTIQTARDIGASVLLSSGTGTGQVKLASGYVAPNWGDVGNPTTALALTGTTISASQVAASVTAGVTVTTNNDKTGYTASTVSDKTGYSLSASGIGAIYTTAMTESYAGQGVVPTLAQILFETRALQAEKAVAGTTLTAKKIDGSTTAGTYTLNDATAPTAITRAT